MADKKRVAITLQEKTLIFQRREEHPDESWYVITIFSVKWSRKVKRSMALKCHNRIKAQKESWRGLNAANVIRSRLVPAIIMKFEGELHEKINDRLLTDPITFDTVKDAKARLTFFIRPSMSLKIYQ